MDQFKQLRPLDPTREDLQVLANNGYTFQRIADKYNRSVRWVKARAAEYADINGRIVQNGKTKSTWNRRHG